MSIDLPFHRPWLEEDEIEEVVATLRSGWLTTGARTHRFEDDFKAYIGCKHALGLNSCTAGLHLSLVALGFEPGSEVITTPMTFPATANVVVHERLKPVFADIEPGTLNIDAAKIEEKISPRTRAITVVHFAGHPCDMDPIQALAEKYGLVVMEDAAHATETRYKGRKIGNLGNLTSFSFYANKNITTGEGGMLTTNDDELADKIRLLRLHGLSRDAWKRFGQSGFSQWELHLPGYKYNLTDVAAALGIHQLKKVERFHALRKQHVEQYNAGFSAFPEIEALQVKDYATSAYHLYIVALRIDRLKVPRDEILNAIQAQGIGVAVHYTPLHLQPYYRDTFGLTPEDLPVATSYSGRLLSLPLFPMMTEGDVDRVVKTVTGLIEKYRK